MGGFDGILFDLDGTLVDSEPCHLEAWNALVEQCGETPLPGWNDDAIGLPDTYAAEKAMRLYPAVAALGAARAVSDRKQAILRDILRARGLSLVFPGVLDGLAQAREAGLKMAVGTNSIRQNTVVTLEATGLAEHFAAFVCIDMVEHGKPAPDIYRQAAQRIGLRPEHCVVLEDSEAGSQAGKAAGCTVFGIENRYSEGKLNAADRLFSDTASALSLVLSERTVAHGCD